MNFLCSFCNFANFIHFYSRIYRQNTFCLTSTVIYIRYSSVMIMDAAEKANRSTRQLIRHSRDIYFRQDPTKEEIESVHILSQDWCKCQVLLAEAIWHHLAPWTTFTSHFFTSPGGIDSTKQQSSTLSIWVNKNLLLQLF